MMNQFFNISDDYHELNSGPHRRRSNRVAAPALCWHAAFWISKFSDLDEDDPEMIDMKRRGIYGDNLRFGVENCIDMFIIKLFKRASIMSERMPAVISAAIGDYIILFRNLYKNDESLEWQAGFADFYDDSGRDRKYSHYHQSKSRKNINLNSRQRDILELSYRIIQIECYRFDYTLKIRLELGVEYFTVSMFAELTNDNSVKDLVGRIFSEKESKKDPAAEDLTSDLSKYLYEDFWHDLHTAIIPDDIELHKNPMRSYVFDQQFADFRGIIMPMSQSVDDSEFVSRIRSLLISSERFECVANLMLGGRALYVSTLGPQAPQAPPHPQIPVFYLIALKSPLNTWQLGRLANRINLLETLRLAALRRLKRLYRSGQILQQLEPSMKYARDSITSEDSDRATLGIERVNKKFDEIHVTERSILYRIERSRYYVDQFAKNIRALRISRIEGFQRYDQFVFRRIGLTFDFIDRLGRRYERAAANLSLLNQYYLSFTANAIAKGGEVVLLVFLIPYYGTSLIKDLVGDGRFGYLFIFSMLVGLFKLHKANRAAFRKRAAWHDGRFILSQIMIAAYIFFILGLPYVENKERSRRCFASLEINSLGCYFASSNSNEK